MDINAERLGEPDASVRVVERPDLSGSPAQTGWEKRSSFFKNRIVRGLAILALPVVAAGSAWFVRDNKANSTEARLRDQSTELVREKRVALALGNSGFTHVVDVRPSREDPNKLVAVISADPKNADACTAAVDINNFPENPHLSFTPADADGEPLIINPDTRSAGDRSDESRMADKIFGLKGENC